MRIRDTFNFFNENVSVKLFYYAEKGYRITHAHFLFFSFLKDRLQKAIHGRVLKPPLNSKTLKQIMADANFLKVGNKNGFHFVSQKIVDDIIIIRAVRNWEVQHVGFRQIVVKMKFVKSKAEVLKFVKPKADSGIYST